MERKTEEGGGNWLCYSETGAHMYILKEALMSSYVDGVSTHTRIQGLIRTYVYTWRSTYKISEHTCEKHLKLKLVRRSKVSIIHVHIH